MFTITARIVNELSILKQSIISESIASEQGSKKEPNDYDVPVCIWIYESQFEA